MDEKASYWIVIVLPCLAMILDCVCGFIAASYKGKVSSTEMRNGLWRKLAEVMAIAAAFMLECAIQVFGNVLNIHASIPVNVFTCAYIFMYEIISVLENVGKVNEPLAYWLIDYIGIDAEKVDRNIREES